MSSVGYTWALGNVELSLQPNSLSRPPYLHYWALDSGKWRLRKITDEKYRRSCCGGTSLPDESACLRYDGVVEHIIMPNESLESICDHYGCSIHTLIQCNGGETFLVNTLPQFLRIPVKMGFPVSKIQSNEKSILLQRFIMETDLSSEEAAEFLTSHQYDYIRAMNQWDQSHTWEQRYLSSIKQSAPIYVTSFSRFHGSDGTMTDVGSALPPPPVGYEWRVLPNSEWELFPLNNLGDVEEREEDQESETALNTQTFFLHRISPSDTLEGLCLKYNTTQRAVMKLNYLSTKKIQFLKEIRIPLSSELSFPAEEMQEAQTGNMEQDLIQKLAEETKISLNEAKYYLQLTDYSYEDALKEWIADEDWSQQNQTERRALPIG